MVQFNLICNNHVIKTLDDLRDHFEQKDILKYYKNGLLMKWLETGGYGKLAEKIAQLKEKNDLEVAKQLAVLLDVSQDKVRGNNAECEKKEMVCKKDSYVKYQNLIEKEEKNKEDSYGYLVEQIISHNNDMKVIKKRIEEINTRYYKQFCRDHKKLFYRLVSEAPMAVFAMLMRDSMRKFYVYEGDEKTGISFGNEIDKCQMNAILVRMLENPVFLKQKLGMELVSRELKYSSINWRTLERIGKHCLILNISSKLRIKPLNLASFPFRKQKDGYDYLDINGRFLIFDGIEWRCEMYEKGVISYMVI